MLQIRPNCEFCDKDLPANDVNAYICSYECTFCENCVKNILENICPNCGGELTRRPVRPEKEYRNGISLQYQPAAVERIHSDFSEAEIIMFSKKVKLLK